MRIHATTAQSIRLPLTHLSGPHSARDLGVGGRHLAAIVRVRVALIMLSSSSSASFGEFAPRTRPRRLENETHSAREGRKAPQKSRPCSRVEIPFEYDSESETSKTPFISFRPI